MHQMQTIVTDVRGGCLSVMRLNSAARAVCAGSFGAVVAKLLWPFVYCFISPYSAAELVITLHSRRKNVVFYIAV